ncbi:CDGSH iron-sulfur domain-containing protein [Planctomycetota bacterium]|nr:CDGSH iron-sulfur domain-containing protein [Planctomycetota bacterium]
MPEIQPTPNGPYLLTGSEKITRLPDGKEFQTGEKAALCRCGASKNKPFCDGSHAAAGFSGEKDEDRTPEKRDAYDGDEVTLFDNRGTCAHAGYCTNNLPAVFKYGDEPWIDPNGASKEEIVKAVHQCPSGALGYAEAGEEKQVQSEGPDVAFVPNGPYLVQGACKVEGCELPEGRTSDRLTLCRCGQSKNKPFCDGTHWNVKFDEDAPSAEG